MKKFLLVSGILLLALAAGAQVKVVGHRGVRHNTRLQPESPYYENTIAALQYCQTLGIYAAEFDVQVTADQKVIVFHGPKVPGLDKPIQKVTFAEARATVLPGGHQMPTIEEYLAEGRKHPETKLICEIKVQPTPQMETLAVEAVIAAVREMGMEDQVEYTTFSEWCIREIHRVAPKAKAIFIDSGVFIKDPDYLKGIGADAVSYDFNGFMNHPDYAVRARELGMETTLWVVNDYEPVNWAILHGIDYVSSDHPEKIKAYVDGLKPFERR